MERVVDSNRFRTRLTEINRPDWLVSRISGQVAAAIATGQAGVLDETFRLAREQKLERVKLYELVLQSYLFLGFPRMLIAATQLDVVWPNATPQVNKTKPISPEESDRWFNNGLALCKKIYGTAFDPLRERVERIAPEVFRWMIIEGYGKVLSRNGLHLIDRELGIMATLVVENRKEQLFSHMRGALNAGAERELVTTILEDLGPDVGDGYQTARELLQREGLSA